MTDNKVAKNVVPLQPELSSDKDEQQYRQSSHRVRMSKKSDINQLKMKRL